MVEKGRGWLAGKISDAVENFKDRAFAEPLADSKEEADVQKLVGRLAAEKFDPYDIAALEEQFPEGSGDLPPPTPPSA